MGNKQSTACLAATPAPHNQPPSPLEVSVKLPDILEKKLPELLEIALEGKKSPAAEIFDGLIGMFMILGPLYLQWSMMQQQIQQHNKGESSSLALVKDTLKKVRRNSQIAKTLNKYEMELVTKIYTDDSNTLQKVGGLDHVVKQLKRYFDSKKKPGSQNKIRLDKGVLLYGNSGCGKSMMATAAAEQTDAVFLALTPSDLKRKFHGESEQMIAATFSLARKLKPTIIFLDECDSHFAKRDPTNNHCSQFDNNLKSIWLQEWDGIKSQSKANKMTQVDNRFDVVILGATNHRVRIDPAFLRRFGMQIEVKEPDESDRDDIFRKIIEPRVKEDESFTIQMFEEGEPDLFQRLAQKTEYFTGSDISSVCNNTFNELYDKHELQAEMEKEETVITLGNDMNTNALHVFGKQQSIVIDLDDFNSHIKTQRENLDVRKEAGRKK